MKRDLTTYSDDRIPVGKVRAYSCESGIVLFLWLFWEVGATSQEAELKN